MKLRKFICIQLLVNCLNIIDTTAEPCETASRLQVVNICTTDTKIQDDSNTVLIKADSRQNCTCQVSIINQDKDISVNIRRFNSHTSSSPSSSQCGLILNFSFRNDTFWIAQCNVDNSVISKTITQNSVMTIRSMTVNGTLEPNEGFCIELKKSSYFRGGNKLKLTCGIGSTTTTVTTHSAVKTTYSIQATTTRPTITTRALTTTTPQNHTKGFTIANFTSTDFYVTTNQANKLKIIDNDGTTIIAIGASLGGFVIIIVVIAMVCIYRRNHTKQTSQTGRTVNNENDDYGLRDNVLYVSSQPTDSAETKKRVECHDTNRLSVDIDGNYSTVDLDEIPSIEESPVDYSLIELVKRTPRESNMKGSANAKPTIAPKPQQKVAIQDDVYAVPEKKKVKHDTAPGEDMCEYAVVIKPKNADKSGDQPSTSNVYAVVEKKNFLSDGKGTITK